MIENESPTEADLLADLAASQEAQGARQGTRARRGRFAVLAAILLGLGALTIFQLSLSGAPTTSYHADPSGVATAPSGACQDFCVSVGC